MQLSVKKGNEKTEETHFSSVVVGGGAAGLTAAIYLGRSKIDSVILEKTVPGGYITTNNRVENYSGFPEGVSGEDLAQLFEQQAKKFGSKIKLEEVIELKLDKTPFQIKTSHSSYTADSLILATGTSNRKLGVPGEEKFIHNGISFCATCDGPFFDGEDIIVVGAGNSGAQEALYLSRFARHITVVEILDHPTAEPILVDRINENDKIELLLSHCVEGFKGEDSLQEVELKNLESKEKKTIKVKGAFIYAGLIPSTDLVRDKLELDDKGFIVTDRRLHTSREGVFAAGDVRNTSLRQIATAVGDGAIVGYEVRKLLEGNK